MDKSDETGEELNESPDKDDAPETYGITIETIREHFKEASEAWDDNRQMALEDIRFAAGEQWPDRVKKAREDDSRPCLTVDKLNQYIRQIVNDGRQNRPSIKVRPVDSGADVKTAAIYRGLIRHIEQRSSADIAYDTALGNAATNGFGYWKITTEYVDENSFDQDLCIRRIRNPLSILLDPFIQSPDGSDIRYAFEIEDMPKEEFKSRWPGKLPQDFETNSDYSEWFAATVRVVRYWCVKKEPRTLYLLVDGSVLTRADYDARKEAGEDIDSLVKESRDIPLTKVYHTLASGAGFLEPPKPWLGKYIPLVPTFGEEIDIEGKLILRGIIRPAKDAQRLYNYSRSAFAERVALTPKTPWVAAEGQVENYEHEWKTANTGNHSVLRYNPVALNGSPIPPPGRTPASDVPAGFAQDMQLSEHDIQGSIGMYSASLGERSNERSGKAILARQKEGDVGTFHYHDNLNRSIRHTGRILVDLIPKVYDSTRVIRTIGDDLKPMEVKLDPTQESAATSNGVETIYNLGVGTYDLAVDTGPSYTTLRAEAASSMVEMTQANPNLMGVIGDLMVRAMDWPDAEAIADRLKLMLDPRILQAEADKKSMTPEMQQIQARFQQELQARDQQIQEMTQAFQDMQNQLQEAKVNAEAKNRDTITKVIDTHIKAYSAETERLKVLSTAMDPQQIEEIVLTTLQSLLEQPSPESPANGAPESTGIPLEQS